MEKKSVEMLLAEREDIQKNWLEEDRHRIEFMCKMNWGEKRMASYENCCRENEKRDSLALGSITWAVLFASSLLSLCALRKEPNLLLLGFLSFLVSTWLNPITTDLRRVYYERILKLPVFLPKPRRPIDMARHAVENATWKIDSAQLDIRRYVSPWWIDKAKRDAIRAKEEEKQALEFLRHMEKQSAEWISDLEKKYAPENAKAAKRAAEMQAELAKQNAEWHEKWNSKRADMIRKHEELEAEQIIKANASASILRPEILSISSDSIDLFEDSVSIPEQTHSSAQITENLEETAQIFIETRTPVLQNLGSFVEPAEGIGNPLYRDANKNEERNDDAIREVKLDLMRRSENLKKNGGLKTERHNEWDIKREAKAGDLTPDSQPSQQSENQIDDSLIESLHDELPVKQQIPISESPEPAQTPTPDADPEIMRETVAVEAIGDEEVGSGIVESQIEQQPKELLSDFAINAPPRQRPARLPRKKADLGSNDPSPAVEGRRKLRTNYAVERNPKLRARAIQIHGRNCCVCGFNFDEVFGKELAQGYIEVHHLNNIASGERTTDPATDLAPLCGNCHAMADRLTLNLESPPRSIVELRALLFPSSRLRAIGQSPPDIAGEA